MCLNCSQWSSFFIHPSYWSPFREQTGHQIQELLHGALELTSSILVGCRFIIILCCSRYELSPKVKLVTKDANMSFSAETLRFWRRAGLGETLKRLKQISVGMVCLCAAKSGTGEKNNYPTVTSHCRAD